MEITVFGPGCARCAEAEALAREVARESGKDVTVTKISDIRQMMAQGILATPAVAVDGAVRCTGRVPSRDELAGWIAGAE